VRSVHRARGRGRDGGRKAWNDEEGADGRPRGDREVSRGLPPQGGGPESAGAAGGEDRECAACRAAPGAREQEHHHERRASGCPQEQL
jgi:hypothetical protein